MIYTRGTVTWAESPKRKQPEQRSAARTHRMQPQAGFIGANCKKNHHASCSTLRCTCECHDKV